MSGMGVAATVRVEVHVGILSPCGYTSGHRLSGQWPIPFFIWEKPVTRLAATKGPKQRQRVDADAHGAGLAALTSSRTLPPSRAVRCPPIAADTARTSGSPIDMSCGP